MIPRRRPSLGAGPELQPVVPEVLPATRPPAVLLARRREEVTEALAARSTEIERFHKVITGAAQLYDGSVYEGPKLPNAVTRTWQHAAYGYVCASEDTEILTRRGWRRYDQIAIGDEVLTLNHGKAVSEWQPIRDLNICRDVAADVVHMESRGHSSITTMEHTWPVIEHRSPWTMADAILRRQRRAASRSGQDRPPSHGVDRGGTDLRRVTVKSKDLRSTHAIVTAAPCAELPVEPKWSDGLVELVGWFWTEGHIRPNGGVVISQSDRVNPEYVARIRAVLRQVFGDPVETLRGSNDRPSWRESASDGVRQFHLNQTAGRALSALAPQRVVATDFVLSLTRAQLELFIQTSVDGDGSRARSGSLRLYQANVERLEAVGLAAILTGRTPHLYRVAGRMDAWVLYLRDRSAVRPVDAAKRGAAMVTREIYRGTVWCPVVDNHTWLARRNGTVYFTGNTSVPELKSAMMYMGNCLSRCRLVVGKRNADGTVEDAFEGQDVVDGLDKGLVEQASEVVGTIRARIGGQSEILRKFGENMFVAGELYLIPDDGPDGLDFEVLSTLELFKEGNGWQRYYGPGFPPQKLRDDQKPIRLWRPSVQYHMLADSSVRSCLEILEELVILTRLVRASAISRMALSGILFVPDELDFPDAEAGPDGQFSEATSGLATDLINTASKAIDDPAAAASYTPFIVQGPAAYGEKIRYITFKAQDSEHVIQRKEALERLAQGLDVEPQVVLGLEASTFANAKEINETTLKIHILPSLQMLCDALTVSVLWPGMAVRKGIDLDRIAEGAPYPDDILSVAVHYDASQLVSRPDRAKEIITLYTTDPTHMAVQVVEAREAVGLDPDVTVDDEELRKRIDAVRLTKIRETIQVAADSPDRAVAIDQAGTQAVTPGESEGEEVIAGRLPSQQGTGSGGGGFGYATDGHPSIAYQISGAAELTVERALERLGARVRAGNHGRGGLTTAEARKIDGLPNGQVCQTLGAAVVGRVLPDGAPLEPDLAAFVDRVRGWLFASGARTPDATANELKLLVQGTVLQQIKGEDVAAPSPADVALLLVGRR